MSDPVEFSLIGKTEINRERERQISGGYDAAHDDKHGREHLIEWAKVYASAGRAVEAAAIVVAIEELDERIPPFEVPTAEPVPGAFFEVTGTRDQLFQIIQGMVDIENRDSLPTAGDSFSMDLWSEMLDWWFEIHDISVIKGAASPAATSTEEPAYEPRYEMFPGTMAALNKLTIRPEQEN